MSREWLTVIIVLLIVAVILDGIRRMRQSRRSAIKMSLSMHKGTSKEDLQQYGSELPSGGARVVSVRQADAASELNQKVKKVQQEKKQTAGRAQRIPQQVALNLEEAVPMLMDSVGEEEKPASHTPASSNRESNSNYLTASKPTKEKLFGEDIVAEIQTDMETDLETDMEAMDERGRIEPQITVEAADSIEEQPDDLYSETLSSRFQHASSDEKLKRTEYSSTNNSNSNAKSKLEPQRDQQISDRQSSRGSRYTLECNDEDDEESNTHYIEPEVVLVVNVMAPKGEKLNGGELLEVVLSEGMRFGNMDIFHHHAGDDGDGSILYSMANIVVPGTFDLNNMQDMLTPGVSLFLALPLEEGGNSLAAFDKMLGTAQAIRAQLGAELKDENRSVLTRQTVEHYRQRIRDFERKQLSRAPA